MNRPILCACLVALCFQLQARADLLSHADHTVPPVPPDTVPIKARPKMVGEKVPSLRGLTVDGEQKDLSQLMDGKFTLLALTGAVMPLDSSVRTYFNGIRPYIEDLGYQIIVVAADSTEALQKVAKYYEHRTIVSDENREAYIAMGLADTKVHGAPLLNGLFLVAPDHKIVFEFVSSDHALAISGEVLVLAAKNYRDLAKAQEFKKEHEPK